MICNILKYPKDGDVSYLCWFYAGYMVWSKKKDPNNLIVDHQFPRKTGHVGGLPHSDKATSIIIIGWIPIFDVWFFGQMQILHGLTSILMVESTMFATNNRSAKAAFWLGHGHITWLQDEWCGNVLLIPSFLGCIFHIWKGFIWVSFHTSI